MYFKITVCGRGFYDAINQDYRLLKIFREMHILLHKEI